MTKVALFAMSLVAVFAGTAMAQDPTDPVKLVSAVIDLARTGQWLLAAIAFVQLGVFLLKKFGPSEYMKKWGSVSVAAGSGVIAILSSIVGGIPWYEAIIVFFAGPGCSLVVDFLHAAGILKRSVSPESAEEPSVDSGENTQEASEKEVW